MALSWRCFSQARTLSGQLPSVARTVYHQVLPFSRLSSGCEPRTVLLIYTAGENVVTTSEWPWSTDRSRVMNSELTENHEA
jgi:hypothetical protein